MKYKITKAEYDALSDALKAAYKQNGDNYILQVEGYEGDDTGELRRALERERGDARTSKARLVEVERLLRELQNADARSRNDITALERSWNERTEAQKTDFERQLSAKDTWIKQSLINGTASQLAAKLCGKDASLILPHIERRLSVEFDNGAPKLRVLDKAGQPSAMSVDDLEKEFVADKSFSGIIVASRASGGADGSGGSKGGSGSGAGKSKTFEEMNDAERTALYRENPTEFRRLSQEAQVRRRGY